ncbi:MAG: MGMT family protein [Lachnospiraceae bacterium]|nr:MGMT family protein [Lachnospiraceae bacterium]
MTDRDTAFDKYFYTKQSNFYDAVYAAVKQIPAGKVATYGQIAALAGNQKAARAVGNALHKNPDEKGIPCYRVVNAKGELSGAFVFGGIYVQRDRLREDGVEVINMRVDLSEYQWDGI